MNKSYPVGTAIKYIGYCHKCKGKTGKIVQVSKDVCWIILPQSTCSVYTRCGSAICNWNDVELLVKKNEQLLFSFMEEQDAQ